MRLTPRKLQKLSAQHETVQNVQVRICIERGNVRWGIGMWLFSLHPVPESGTCSLT